jgi:hypothetical protein
MPQPMLKVSKTYNRSIDMHRLVIVALSGALLLAFGDAGFADDQCKPTVIPQTVACPNSNIQTFASATNPCDCDATVTIKLKNGAGAAIIPLSKKKWNGTRNGWGLRTERGGVHFHI